MLLIALTVSAQSISQQASGEREFVGTINRTLKIRMKLSKSGKALSGSYVYESVGQKLRLNGTVDEDEFELNESDERGTQTGKFAGKFVTDDWIEGTWSSGKKELPFTAFATGGKRVPASDPTDKISGEYQRIYQSRPDKDTSVLDIWRLQDGRVRVLGHSSRVGNAKTGNVNVGEIDGVYDLKGSNVLVTDGDEDDDCHFTITFAANALTVTKDNLKCGGLNVSFNGQYRKTGPPKSQ
jgi:hypothetical protein